MAEQAGASDCIFCRIGRGELGTKFVGESEGAVAFYDLQPQAPTHVLIVPRRHVASLDELTEDDAAMIGDLLLLAAQVARREGIADRGYRVLTNVGADAGQSVHHLHFHLLGGRQMHTSLA